LETLTPEKSIQRINNTKQTEEKNMAENIDVLGGTVGKALEKGKMAVGEIMRITLGVASDFMTPEQIEKRKVLGTAPFIELEVGIPDTGAIFTKTFAYYGGNVPPNSIHGKIVSMYGEITEGGDINLITKEVPGRDGAFVVWDLVL